MDDENLIRDKVSAEINGLIAYYIHIHELEPKTLWKILSQTIRNSRTKYDASPELVQSMLDSALASLRCS